MATRDAFVLFCRLRLMPRICLRQTTVYELPERDGDAVDYALAPDGRPQPLPLRDHRLARNLRKLLPYFRARLVYDGDMRLLLVYLFAHHVLSPL